MSDPVRAEAPPLSAERARRERSAAWVRLIVFGSALAGAGLLGHVVKLPGVTLCTFQLLWGRPCPGCGMTRSITYLAQGDVLTSVRYHPLGIVFFVATVLAFAGAVLHLVTGRDRFWELVERHATWIAITLLVVLIGLWIVRGFVVPGWSPDPIR